MGMAIIFLLHYFMVTILNVNDVLVSAIRGAMSSEAGYTSLINELWENSNSLNIIKGTTAAVALLMITGLTFAYLIMYIKRMLTISLLTCVAPLITTTYAMDKVSDNKSQVLNTWIREYSYNVLIQPFHCIIYVVFVKNAVDMLAYTSQSFIAVILAIMCMSFMMLAEGIVKAIFGLNGSTMSSAAASIAAFTAGATMAANFTGKVKKAESVIQGNVKKEAELAKQMPKTKSSNINTDNANVKDKAKTLGEKALAGAGKVAGGLKKVYLNPKLTGIQTAMITGTLALTQGNAATAIQSARAGKAAGDTIGAHISEHEKLKQLERNEKMFEREYDVYQLANPGSDMHAVTAQLLGMKPGEAVPQHMQSYAAFVSGLKQSYEIAGYEDANQAVLDKVDQLHRYQ